MTSEHIKIEPSSDPIRDSFSENADLPTPPTTMSPPTASTATPKLTPPTTEASSSSSDPPSSSPPTPPKIPLSPLPEDPQIISSILNLSFHLYPLIAERLRLRFLNLIVSPRDCLDFYADIFSPIGKIQEWERVQFRIPARAWVESKEMMATRAIGKVGDRESLEAMIGQKSGTLREVLEKVFEEEKERCWEEGIRKEVGKVGKREWTIAEVRERWGLLVEAGMAG